MAIRSLELFWDQPHRLVLATANSVQIGPLFLLFSSSSLYLALSLSLYMFVDEWTVISINLFNCVILVIFLINYTWHAGRKSNYLHFNDFPWTSDLFKNFRNIFNWKWVGKTLLLKVGTVRTWAIQRLCFWHRMSGEWSRRGLGTMASLCCCSGHSGTSLWCQDYSFYYYFIFLNEAICPLSKTIIPECLGL